MNTTDANEPDEVQHDLLFTAACEFGDPISITQLHDETIKNVCKSFQNNIARLRAMAFVPQSVVQVSTEHLLRLSQAVFDVLGKPVMEDSELEPNRAAITSRYSELALGRFFDDKRDMLHTLTRDTLFHNKYSNVNAGLVRPGFVALLGAQIIGAWTAFDSLTNDLWIAAVNLRPKTLVDRITKTVSAKLLQKHDYNWKGKMGELLKEDFSSFEATKAAFSKLFPGTAIAGVFDNAELKATCALRTCLVHNAGIATESASTATRGWPIWKDVQPNSPIPLDGERVAKTTDIVIQAGSDLIRLVDGWLEAIPE